MQNPDKETLEKWHKDPSNWKFGFFYYNPEDTRLLPPKRIKWMGFTINFANTKAVIGFVLFLIFIVLLVLYGPTKKY